MQTTISLHKYDTSLLADKLPKPQAGKKWYFVRESGYPYDLNTPLRFYTFSLAPIITLAGHSSDKSEIDEDERRAWVKVKNTLKREGKPETVEAVRDTVRNLLGTHKLTNKQAQFLFQEFRA